MPPQDADNASLDTRSFAVARRDRNCNRMILLASGFALVACGALRIMLTIAPCA